MRKNIEQSKLLRKLVLFGRQIKWPLLLGVGLLSARVEHFAIWADKTAPAKIDRKAMWALCAKYFKEEWPNKEDRLKMRRRGRVFARWIQRKQSGGAGWLLNKKTDGSSPENEAERPFAVRLHAFSINGKTIDPCWTEAWDSELEGLKFMLPSALQKARADGLEKMNNDAIMGVLRARPDRSAKNPEQNARDSVLEAACLDRDFPGVASALANGANPAGRAGAALGIAARWWAGGDLQNAPEAQAFVQAFNAWPNEKEREIAWQMAMTETLVMNFEASVWLAGLKPAEAKWPQEISEWARSAEWTPEQALLINAPGVKLEESRREDVLLDAVLKGDAAVLDAEFEHTAATAGLACALLFHAPKTWPDRSSEAWPPFLECVDKLRKAVGREGDAAKWDVFVARLAGRQVIEENMAEAFAIAAEPSPIPDESDGARAQRKQIGLQWLLQESLWITRTRGGYYEKAEAVAKTKRASVAKALALGAKIGAESFLAECRDNESFRIWVSQKHELRHPWGPLFSLILENGADLTLAQQWAKEFVESKHGPTPGRDSAFYWSDLRIRLLALAEQKEMNALLGSGAAKLCGGEHEGERAITETARADAAEECAQEGAGGASPREAHLSVIRPAGRAPRRL